MQIADKFSTSVFACIFYVFSNTIGIRLPFVISPSNNFTESCQLNVLHFQVRSTVICAALQSVRVLAFNLGKFWRTSIQPRESGRAGGTERRDRLCLRAGESMLHTNRKLNAKTDVSKIASSMDARACTPCAGASLCIRS